MKQIQFFKRLLTLSLLLGTTMLLAGQPTPVDAQSENPNAYGSTAGSPNNSVYVDASGNVGIGMTSPQARLDLANGPTWRSGWKRTIRMGAANLIEFVSKDISFGVGGDNSGNLVFFAADSNSSGPTTGSMALDKNGNLNITGNMGLGVISPQARLDLASGPTWRSGWKRTIRMGAANLIEFVSQDTSFGIGGDNSGNLVFFAADGNSSGPTTGSMALNKNGNLNVSGTTTTSVLQITGGADLAEPFAINDTTDVEPGTVVILDADSPGELRVANGAYDPLVAGVISGAGDIQPGLIMQQEEAATVNGEMRPVALTGKVYAKAVGPVQIGDLLTTAEIPGHAMAATDRDRAFGATLGKAMSALDEGETGLVLVLVALQ